MQQTKRAYSDDGDTTVDTCVERSPSVVDGCAVGESSEQVSVDEVPVEDGAARLGRCIGTRLYTPPLACNLRLSLVKAGGDAGRCSCRTSMRSARPAGEKLLSYAPVLECRQSTCRTGCGMFRLSPSELKGCLLLCACKAAQNQFLS